MCFAAHNKTGRNAMALYSSPQDMIYEERLATFKDIHSVTIDKYYLVNAGFYSRNCNKLTARENIQVSPPNTNYGERLASFKNEHFFDVGVETLAKAGYYLKLIDNDDKSWIKR